MKRGADRWMFTEEKETRRGKNGRRSAFSQEEEDSREIESWEYPDVISIESSIVSSLTGAIRQSDNMEKESLPKEDNIVPIEDRDTECGENKPSVSDTILVESPKEGTHRKLLNGWDYSMLGFFSGRTKTNPKTMVTKSYQRYLLKYFLGVLGVVIVISIIVIFAHRDNSNDGQSLHEDMNSVLTPREKALMDILKSVSPKGLDEKGSPQHQAKEWIFHSDLLKLAPSMTVSSERVIQRYVLAVFYYSTNGPKTWKYNNWLEGDECSIMFWTGISCNDDNIVRAVAFGK